MSDSPIALRQQTDQLNSEIPDVFPTTSSEPQSSLNLPPLLLLDGGLGTTLEDSHQCSFTSTSTPTWSSHLLISSSSILRDAHRSFADAGADVVLTATYQASIEGFARTPRLDVDGDGPTRRGSCYSPEEAAAFMHSAVPLARSAFGVRNKGGIVGLSLGAYGATMVPSAEYTGRYPIEMGGIRALERWHAQRVRVFEGHGATWEGIDLVAFETLPHVNEVTAVRGAMDLLATGRRKPFWISCVFPNEDERLPDGSEVVDVVRAMLGQDPLKAATMNPLPLPMGIGINCTKVQKLRSLVNKFENAAVFMDMALPHLVLCPDGANNLKYDATSQKWVPRESAADVRAWDEDMFAIVEEVQKRNKWAGIIVGGCCKTKPQDIAGLRKKLGQRR